MKLQARVAVGCSNATCETPKILGRRSSDESDLGHDTLLTDIPEGGETLCVGVNV